MSDIKLFRLTPSSVAELPSHSVAVEKSLQTLIERNLDTFLAVPFLASEYTTGKVHGGQDVRDRFEALRAFLLALGEDVQMNTLAYYIAFRRVKNFACVEIHPQTSKLVAFDKVNPDTVTLEPGFTRDVRKVGHYGTGDLEVSITSNEDLERAKPLLVASYEAS